MKTGKKLLSVILILILMLCVLPIGAFSASGFSPRLTAPTSDNAYYYANNQFYQWGCGLPNCTCYAYGRAYEILGSKPNLCPNNAGAWWKYNVTNGYYPYGQTPKLGAIAVWDKYDDSNGHVAVVEEINGSKVTLSESHYSGKFFDTKVMNADASDYLKSYRFRGYIYIIDSEPATPPAAPSVRLSKNTLEVNENATVTWTSAEGATSYWVTCRLGNELVINNENNKFSQTISFKNPGKYYLTVTACNDVGETISESIEITVSASTAHQHLWNIVYTVDKQPTCTEKGSKSIHCKTCSEKKNITEIPALGHSFGGWKIKTAATATKEGVEERTCHCGAKETRAIPKLGTQSVVSVAFDSKAVETNYSRTFTLTPNIETIGNPEYTVEYTSSNPKIATVDQNGNVKTTGTGTATITVTVTDSNGNEVTDTCEVKVTYTFIQLILYIVCFGWLWM